MTHFCETFERDEDGWWVAECNCGWVSPPYPDSSDAVDGFAQHVLETG